MRHLKHPLKIILTGLFAMITTINAYTSDDGTFQLKSNVFITNWLVCGPFPLSDEKNIDKGSNRKTGKG